MADDDGYKFPVDLTSIMLFASAIGETNPIYYDEEYAAKTPLGQVVAPPSFASAGAHWDPNYFLRGVRKIPAPRPKPAALRSIECRTGPGAASACRSMPRRSGCAT